MPASSAKPLTVHQRHEAHLAHLRHLGLATEPGHHPRPRPPAPRPALPPPPKPPPKGGGTPPPPAPAPGPHPPEVNVPDVVAAWTALVTTAEQAYADRAGILLAAVSLDTEDAAARFWAQVSAAYQAAADARDAATPEAADQAADRAWHQVADRAAAAYTDEIGRIFTRFAAANGPLESTFEAIRTASVPQITEFTPPPPPPPAGT